MGVCSSSAATDRLHAHHGTTGGGGGGGRRHHHQMMPASAAHTPQSDLDDDAAAAARTSTGGGAGAGGHAMPATRHRVHSSSSRNDDFVATRANAEDGCSFAASASVQGDGIPKPSKRKSAKPQVSLPLAPILLPQSSHTTATPRAPTHTPSVNAQTNRNTATAREGIAGHSVPPPTPSMSRSKRTPKLAKANSYKKLGGGAGASVRKSKRTPQSELLLHPGAVDSMSGESSCSGLGPPLTREERLAAGDTSALRPPDASGKSSPMPYEHDSSKQKELSESLRPRQVSTIRPVPSSLRPEITSTPMTGAVTADENNTPDRIDLSGPPVLPDRAPDHRSSHDALSDFHALTPPDKLHGKSKRKSSTKKSPKLRPTSAQSGQQGDDSHEAPKQKRQWFRSIRHRLRLSKSNSAGMRALSASLSGPNELHNESGSKSRNIFTSPSQGMFKKRGTTGGGGGLADNGGNTAEPLAFTPGLARHGAHTPTSKTDYATFATDTLRNRGSLTSVASRPSFTVVPLTTKNLRTHYENQKGAEKRSRVQITAQILEDNIQSSVVQERLEKQHMEKESGSSRGHMQHETDAESLTSKTSSGAYDARALTRRDQCKRAGARVFNNRRLSEAYSSVTTDSEKYYDVSGDHSHLSRARIGAGVGYHTKRDSESFASERDGDSKTMLGRQLTDTSAKSSQPPVCFCVAGETLFAATQPLYVVMCDEFCTQSVNRHRSSSPPTTIDLRDRPNRPSADAQRRRIAAKLYARRHHHQHSGGSSSRSNRSNHRHHHHRSSEKPLPPLPAKPLPPVPSNSGRSRSRQRPPTSWRPSLSKPISHNELNLALDGAEHSSPKAAAVHHRNGGEVPPRSHLPEHLRGADFPQRHPSPSPLSGPVSLRQNTLLQQHHKRIGGVLPQEIHRMNSSGERLLASVTANDY